jgi:hypothetical protein
MHITNKNQEFTLQIMLYVNRRQNKHYASIQIIEIILLFHFWQYIKYTRIKTSKTYNNYFNDYTKIKSDIRS